MNSGKSAFDLPETPLAADAPGVFDPPLAADPSIGIDLPLTRNPPAVFDLPGARQIVGRGFDLSLRASRQLRGASLYVGILLVAIVGPAVALSLAVVSSAPADLPDLGRDFVAGRGSSVAIGSEWLAAASILWILVLISLAGAVIVLIEGQIVGISILAGLHAGHPLRLREAVTRSRQTFWRVVWASVLVTVPLLGAQGIVSSTIARADAPDEAATLFATLLVTAIGAPFGYVITGIVVGDVGPAEAIRRSVRLARTRWRLAFIIAFFSAVFSSVEVLALGAGFDILFRLGNAVGLGFGSDLTASLGTLGVLLAATAALGSLLFTAAALAAAPQVVAFVGLTHYHAGLDGARLGAQVALPVPALSGSPLSDATAGVDQGAAWTGRATTPRFQWVTRPMAAAIVGGALLAALGSVALAGRP